MPLPAPAAPTDTACAKGQHTAGAQYVPVSSTRKSWQGRGDGEKLQLRRSWEKRGTEEEGGVEEGGNTGGAQ